MIMMRRRPLARAAIVGGAAYHAGKKVQQGREQDAETEARLAQLEEQQYAQQQYAQPAPPPAAAAPAAPAGDDTVAKLKELAGLHEQGILTDEEFAAAKQQLLGG